MVTFPSATPTAPLFRPLSAARLIQDVWFGVGLLAMLAACAPLPPTPGTVPSNTTAGSEPSPPSSAPLANPNPNTTRSAGPPPPGTLMRSRSRWVPASFADLPGWGQDRPGEWAPAFRLGCATPPSAWKALCADWLRAPPQGDEATRAWLETRLRVFRVEALDGEGSGLITGYFEPLIAASRKAEGKRKVPLYGPPADFGQRKPWWTRQQVDTLPAARTALRGRELAWVEDPLDALILHIQGSGRLLLREPDGSEKLVRAAFAGHNEQPYRSVGRWLIDQGELSLAEASWPGIKDWARRNPGRLQEMLHQNPRYVFFREEPLPDPSLGPKGAQAVPLTPGRSIAVDPQSLPYGTPAWLDTTEPLSARPLRRLVMAQDTGSAITGAVRADFFWGWGEEAEAQAGRMKQALRLWVLWPKP